ncbi:unnamed protein product [Diabrotica balteata]|nr:unnamed protein product [Diabrotica balteata]
MSDETPGVGQGALPPREGQSLRLLAERPTTGATVRVAQVVGGQYVLTTQSHGMPALAQIAAGNPNVTRLISISPTRGGQTSPLRPSLANQSIVNVLTKSRPNPNVRLQLFQSGESSGNNVQHGPHSRSLKRPLSSTGEKKDSYSSKLQHVMNHRIVRSKLVKEKYNEHLLEAYYLESGNNILDLYQFAKRPKTQAYLAYLKEHAIDPRDYPELQTATVTVPQTTPNTPTATSVSSLPGISHSYAIQTTSSTVTTPESNSNTSTPKSVSVKVKSTSLTNTVSQEMIVEKAKQEAYVVQRIADLQKEGIWSERRLPKVQDMPRPKAHWDFLIEEMVWLAADFAQERKWKKAAAKKCARMVQKYFQDKALAAQKAEKAHEQNLRRIAAFCAKEIKIFWNNVEKLVEYKQNTILEEKRKKALDQQLSFIVDQTEKYSQLLAEGMNKTAEQPPSSAPSRSVSRTQSDTEFDPELQSDEDDEETIAREEALDNEGHKEEIEALQKESQMEHNPFSESEDSDDDTDSKKESFIDDKQQSDDSESSKDEDTEDESEDESVKVTEPVDKEEHDELKILVEDSQKEGETKTEQDTKDDLINDAAAIAESIQPKGNTLSSTNVSTNIPFLLKYTLREYQHIGLDWLVTMYDRKLNGILADEMGLGKTIQTIALLSHLACEKENWGPHLIVVPTSVMLNWEMECKKWCPAFKILTYYGTQKERKFKRIGWTKPNAFHICITSYKLVIQDHQSFRRKKWKYLILDEAQNIKNFKSQRWQLLLNFQTQQRLLLTGTPLQNNLMELWSLMHFLMPNVFQSHREFKEWFSNPVTGMIEGNSEYNESIIKRLHKVLRPFLLRRLKSEVEKQMPKKYEHVVMCRLSKRQRYLYDDYMSRAKTRETLSTGNLLSVINVLMQLRKVCNHPNLFEIRPTTSPFQCDNIRLHIPSIVYSALDYDLDKHVNLQALNLVLIMQEIHFGSYQCYRMRQSRNSKKIFEMETNSCKNPPPCPPCKLAMRVLPNKPSTDEKSEKREGQALSQPPPLQVKGISQPNMKMKVSGVQFVPQSILKSIPVVNISQGATGQIGAPVSVTSVLKPQDKISASFAQLVQTSTGKHLLLTSNPNITTSPVTTTTPGGQKLTFLSKQPVSTIGNAGHAVTKAYVKFQLTSVTTASTFTTVTTANSNTISVAKSEDNKGMRMSVGNDYIGKLYSKQNSLDVRWNSDEKNLGLTNEDDPKGERKKRLSLMSRINKIRCSALPLYGRDFQEAVKIYTPNKLGVWNGGHIHCLNTLYNKDARNETTDCLKDALFNPERRLEGLKDTFDRFIFYVPSVKVAEPELQVWHPPPSKYWGQKHDKQLIQKLFLKPATPLHSIASAMVTQFPDPRLIQYDCGKLQTLDILLRKLKLEGHRVLIFTQMTKMLDVLEAFLNYHGHIYLRLDGTTKVDQRQQVSKVPLSEREFLLDQRGPRKMVISTVDRERTRKYIQREQRQKTKDTVVIESDINPIPECDSSSSSESNNFINDNDDVTFQDDVSVPSTSKGVNKNQMRIQLKNFAKTCDRHGISDRSAAALASAVLTDIGIITSADSSNVIDKNKVRRESSSKKRCKGLSSNDHGRTHNTLQEPGCNYLRHVSPLSGTSENIKSSIIQFLIENSIALQEIEAIGCDGTVVNTGVKGGVIRLLEEHLQNRFSGLYVCYMQMNYPFDIFFTIFFHHLDGDTSGPRGFSGPIGKQLLQCDQLPIVAFKPIKGNLPTIPESILKELSTDQKYLYEMYHVVSSGQCTTSVYRSKTRTPGTFKVLMERFNGDKRIFAFILSTRSGGVGVNLTGADTVIFYDSDWNPTMDAQAQDRCHRIGQTRDVHIYRLVSERTIEENILKKANQKRLLGDLAIEGGNFTTAYFKSSTIQDLFNIDQNEENASARMSEIVELKKEREKALSTDLLHSVDDKATVGALENALAACEDDQDVQAAKTAKAEAVADLAEFDENIPLDDQEKEPEISKAEQEINNIIEKLTPMKKYAMNFIEATESAWSAEQLAAATREIEEQKKEWEQNRLAAMREEEERRARELEEEGDIITYSRDDATNQVSSKNKKINRYNRILSNKRVRLKKDGDEDVEKKLKED